MNKWISRKNILLLVSAFTLIVSIYLIQAWPSLQAINTKLDRSNTLVQRIESAPMILRQQDQQLDRLAKQVSQFQSTQQDISSHIAFVEYLEEICRQHKVKIVSLPREATQLVEGYSLVEERFSLEGGIHDILKVLHQIEQQDRVGSIAYLSLQRTSLSLFSKRQNVLVGSVALYRLHTQS